MRKSSQNGSAILMTITFIFALSLLLLQAMHRQLDNLLLISRNEQHYLRSYNLAISALSWGINQRWPLHQFANTRQSKKFWHCQEHLSEALRVCIKASVTPNIFVLRGEGLVNHHGQKIDLYQRVAPDNVQVSPEGHHIVGIAQGWLDFCPEKERGFCSG
ncbi:YgdB family protein [Yersinia nurmii]|uniref:Membrane protein n=1 Tax=Yersinia nurmii TaxID=685706 RepID=A0AAW7K2G7_9GAMM|nr:YgdB family protein [Yersinia nurmii]MDN0087692.1 YgdB family protein [Yersinia nurmii]CNE85733.1 membrane protein [Yersinia nurmii]